MRRQRNVCELVQVLLHLEYLVDERLVRHAIQIATAERRRQLGRRPDWRRRVVYGALLPAWAIGSSSAAEQLYTTAIAPTRGPNGWGEPDDYDYYAQNWIWFGLALWTGLASPPELTP